MGQRTVTLEQHFLAERRRDRELDPELCALLGQIALTGKVFARELARAALAGHTGASGATNVTGDTQKKLDVFADRVTVDTMETSGLVAAIVSEELEEALVLKAGERAPFVLCVDPLDGSSNSDINGSVGTIFGVYRRLSSGALDLQKDLLRAGREQVAAGYVMYGPSTLLAYTVGSGVHGFTLDPDVGEFVLSHERLRCPERGPYYSANLARLAEWEPGIARFIDHLVSEEAARKEGRKPYSMRYVGALVADAHRSLLEGGIYFYPPDPGHPSGKLRLLYECAPIAMLFEQAGGRASTGRERILDVAAQTIHQRLPFVVGSRVEVELFERFLAGGAA